MPFGEDGKVPNSVLQGDGYLMRCQNCQKLLDPAFFTIDENHEICDPCMQ